MKIAPRPLPPPARTDAPAPAKTEWQPPHGEVRRAGYRFSAAIFDQVMKRFGVGDADALLRTAAALDEGNRYLSGDELRRAGEQRAASFSRGFDWHADVVEDVLERHHLTEQHALLQAAMGVDDGDRRLERPELERAAQALEKVLAPNDLRAALARIEKLQGRRELTLTPIGASGGEPIYAAHLPCRRGEPALRVVVSAGVHGNEPCGPGAAVLLIEQLLANPRLRDRVEFTVVTLVNPRGYAQGTRRTPEGEDLNRSIDPGRAGPEEADAVERFVTRTKCDLFLDLHSTRPDRSGFFVVHRSCEDILPSAVRRFRGGWPLLHADTEPYHLQMPGVATSANQGTLKDFAFEQGARWSATVEAPGSVSYLDQVLGENELTHRIIEAALEKVEREGAAARSA